MDGDSAAVTRRDVLRGAAGAVGIAGASGTAAAQEDGGGTTTDGGGGNQSGGGGGGGGGGSETVAVGPGGDLVFEPELLQIAPGTTVRFVWESDGHNVVPEEQPDDTSWEGVEELHDAGFEYSHTFETLGKYRYVCTPHASAGMVGDIEVMENPPSEGEGGGHASILPDSAKTLGVATVGAMTSVLGLAYVFMKYGGDYSQAIEESEQ